MNKKNLKLEAQGPEKVGVAVSDRVADVNPRPILTTSGCGCGGHSLKKKTHK